jgi:hypothetical protein
MFTQNKTLRSSVDRSYFRLGRHHLELGNRFWESGDEWTDRETGTVVDLMYRTPEWIDAELARSLDQHQCSVGYSTCLWHNVRTSKILFDRNGWFANLHAKAQQPYPAQLARAIIAKNYPLLRGANSSFPMQILRAVDREDVVSVNHRVVDDLEPLLVRSALHLNDQNTEYRE